MAIPDELNGLMRKVAKGGTFEVSLYEGDRFVLKGKLKTVRKKVFERGSSRSDLDLIIVVPWDFNQGTVSWDREFWSEKDGRLYWFIPFVEKYSQWIDAKPDDVYVGIKNDDGEEVVISYPFFLDLLRYSWDLEELKENDEKFKDLFRELIAEVRSIREANSDRFLAFVFGVLVGCFISFMIVLTAEVLSPDSGLRPQVPKVSPEAKIEITPKTPKETGK